MTYHSHILNSNHSHIIGRTDPITGDTVKENDRVVFCAACKSCFLKESWEYMNEVHCEQSSTLASIPLLQSTIIAKKKPKFIVEIRNNNSSGIFKLLSFIFTTFTIGLPLQLIFAVENAMLFGLLAGFIVVPIVSHFSSSQKFKHFVGEDKKDVRLFTTHIELGESDYLLSSIREIKYQRDISTNLPSLLLYFQSGGLIVHGLPIVEGEQTDKLLTGLAKISKMVKISFASGNRGELRTMQNIQAQTEGNIQVTGLENINERSERQPTNYLPNSFYEEFRNAVEAHQNSTPNEIITTRNESTEEYNNYYDRFMDNRRR
ncbi:hypothetical protein [Bernardetia sp.]|uniref:hypothetical protein n=1 Tax=Bernardetia sp. TaxID=1937974 RepID=UPI0025BAA577|nr:hypothetical protein [Bernardetia sp.]